MPHSKSPKCLPCDWLIRYLYPATVTLGKTANGDGHTVTATIYIELAVLLSLKWLLWGRGSALWRSAVLRVTLAPYILYLCWCISLPAVCDRTGSSWQLQLYCVNNNSLSNLGFYRWTYEEYDQLSWAPFCSVADKLSLLVHWLVATCSQCKCIDVAAWNRFAVGMSLIGVSQQVTCVIALGLKSVYISLCMTGWMWKNSTQSLSNQIFCKQACIALVFM